MAKAAVHGLVETKGEFQVKGVVTGTQKNNFYTDKKTRKGKDFRMVNFGVEFEKGKVMYISLNGTPQDNVYFSKKNKETKQTEVEKVPFAQRMTFNKEGFQLIGVNIGIEKDEEGKNIKKRMVDFDATKYIAEHLKDGQSVFVKGSVEYGSFVDEKGNKKRTVKYIPSQISLCSEINFDDEEFESQHAFNHVIVFQKIEKDEDQFKLQANIVNYGGIEDAEFVIKEKGLANTLRTKLKQYNAIRVHGDIEVSETVVDADDDVWGEEDKTKSVSAPTIRQMVIKGATPSTLDTNTYSEDVFNDGIEKLKAKEQAKEDWGSSNQKEVQEDEEEW